MSKIYRNLKKISIPKEAFINKCDGRVFIFTSPSETRRKSNRKVIGRAANQTEMYPNDVFKALYPNEWQEAYPEDNTPPYVISCGLYSLLLGVGYKTGLYKTLVDCYGAKHANHIMDFAMYSLKEKSDVAMSYSESMRTEMCFSKNINGDEWWSQFFKSMIDEDTSYRFRTAWLDKCKGNGLNSVWLSIDGSNVDCSSTHADLAEKGKAKSGKKDADIIGFLYAVDADTGVPVTYFVNPGGVVDSKAIKGAVEFLSGQGITVKGFILDRGSCYLGVLKMLKEKNYDYVVMLKSNTNGHTKMYSDHAEEIRWNVKYLISEDSVFGISAKEKIFAELDSSTIALYLDGVNGDERSATLLKKVFRAWKSARQGVFDMSEDVKKYFEVSKDGKPTLLTDDLQSDINIKGYYSIASSKPMSVEEIHNIYYLRDASEKQFMFIKTQLGFNALRVHSDESLKNKLMIAFVAGILRNEIQNTCKNLDLPVNKTIATMSRIQLFYASDNTYAVSMLPSTKQKDLLQSFGMETNDLVEIANYYNTRKFGSIYDETNPKPKHETAEPKKRGRPRKNTDGVQTHALA